MKGTVAFMKKKIEQRCPMYKTREDIIDTWFLGLSDLDKSVGFKNISKEEKIATVLVAIALVLINI